MSEKPSANNHDNFNPLAEAEQRASVGRQIYEKYMEDGVDKLSIQDRVKGHQDMADYLKSRPYEDNNGRLHDPTTGAYKTKERSGEVYTPASTEFETGQETDEYKTMSESELAKRLAEAEFHSDRTTQESLNDAIMDKVIDKNLSESLENSDGTPRDRSEKDIYLDRILAIKDKELARLKQIAETGNDWAPPTPGTGTGDLPPETDPTKEKSLDEEIGNAVNRVLEIDPEDDTDDETPPEPPASPELSSERTKELNDARDAYAKLTAKRRGELLNSSKEELEAAKQRYEAALRSCGEDARTIMQELGLEADDIRSLAVDSLIREQTRLQSMIRDERESMSEGKKLARVYAWFGRQSGIKGKLKKALALGVVGLPIGVPIGVLAGTLGVALFGPFGGAVAGAGLARGVTRGLASAKINKESSAMSHAEAQKTQDVVIGAEAIKAYMDAHDGSLPKAEDITRIVEERTKEQLHSGRYRTAKFATSSMLFGALGAIGGHYISELFSGGPENTGIVEPAEPTAPEPPVEPIEPTPAPTAPVVPVEPTPIPTLPAEVIAPSFENYQYPWNWAVEQVGAPQAKGFLESLAEKAAQAGHTVEWHNMNTPNQWLEIDGLSDTKSVLEILNTYRG